MDIAPIRRVSSHNVRFRHVEFLVDIGEDGHVAPSCALDQAL